MISALEIQGVPIECINQAALTYHVPTTLIISVLLVERGRVGLAVPNKNNSFDYGPMQINSIWLEKLARYGYTREKIQYDSCANVMAGTWILACNISNANAIWYGVGGYHSYTPCLNQQYQYQVSKTHQLLSNLLSTKASE